MKYFKKFALALAMLVLPAFAMAVCNPFIPNTVLTASALNSAIAAPCITSGTITGAVMSGNTLDGTAIGSITPSSVFGTYFTSNTVFPTTGGYSLTATSTSAANTANASIGLKSQTRGAAVTASADTFGNIDAWGWNGTAYAYAASVDFISKSTFSGTNYQSAITFNTTASASTTPALVGTLDNTGFSLLSGLLAAGTFSDAYTDGVVVDYATGNGRVSVGAADTLTIYTGGIATTQMEQISATGTTVVGIKYGTTGAGKLASSSTAPTIASGFGTTPSVVASNGTAAFIINVGTGGTASSGVITMPAATTGWSCDVSPTAAPQAAAVMYSTPTSTTSITITNYTQSTGAPLAWPASTVIAVNCIGY